MPTWVPASNSHCPLTHSGFDHTWTPVQCTCHIPGPLADMKTLGMSQAWSICFHRTYRILYPIHHHPHPLIISFLPPILTFIRLKKKKKPNNHCLFFTHCPFSSPSFVAKLWNPTACPVFTSLPSIQHWLSPCISSWSGQANQYNPKHLALNFSAVFKCINHPALPCF